METPEQILKKENTSHRETTLLGLHLEIQTSLYHKRNFYNLNVVRFPCKSSTISLKMFFATIIAEICRICGANSSVVELIKTSKVFLYRMMGQGVHLLGVKKVLAKMINRQVPHFENYDTNNRGLIQQLLT